MTASLADIDDALVTALSALVAEPQTESDPFAYVGRYAGAVPPEGLQVFKFPCALVRFNGETSTRVVKTWGGDTEETGTASWDVLVACEDPQSIDSGMRGTASAPGLLRLVDAALAAVNALAVTGLFQYQPVRYVATRPELVVRNAVYVYAVALEAVREAPQATNPDPAASLPYVNPIDGDVNLEGTADAAPNPLVQFESEPNP